jgi:hypothetical protein
MIGILLIVVFELCETKLEPSLKTNLKLDRKLKHKEKKKQKSYLGRFSHHSTQPCPSALARWAKYHPPVRLGRDPSARPPCTGDVPMSCGTR